MNELLRRTRRVSNRHNNQRHERGLRVTAMRRRGQLLIIGPRDGQQEYGLGEGFYLMPDRRAEGDESPALRFMSLPERGVPYVPFQHVHRGRAVNVMFLHPGGIFHT